MLTKRCANGEKMRPRCARGCAGPSCCPVDDACWPALQLNLMGFRGRDGPTSKVRMLRKHIAAGLLEIQVTTRILLDAMIANLVAFSVHFFY